MNQSHILQMQSTIFKVTNKEAKMSARKKESGSNSTREKGGASPSSSGSKTSAKTVSTSRSLESSPSGKSIPNYLKPTLSSSGDTTKLQGRKPVSKTDTALKPNQSRRRSFDKPHSPTPTPKAPTPTFRSSSSGAKAATASSARGDRSSKGTRDTPGKQTSLHANARPVVNVKKSPTILGKKAESHTASSRKGPKLNNPTILAGHQEKEHEDEDMISKQIEPKIDSPTSVEQDHAHIAKAESPTIEEIDASSTSKEEHNDGNSVKIESPAASEQHEANDGVAESPTNVEQGDTNEGDIMSEHDEELDNKSCIEEQEMEMEEESINDDINPDENAAGSVEEAEDRERDDEEEEASEVDDDGESHEAEAGEVEDEENAATKHAHGKNELAHSNNVAEETANKLHEQSNRVRALAGAFETAISVEDPK